MGIIINATKDMSIKFFKFFIVVCFNWFITVSSLLQIYQVQNVATKIIPYYCRGVFLTVIGKIWGNNIDVDPQKLFTRIVILTAGKDSKSYWLRYLAALSMTWHINMEFVFMGFNLFLPEELTNHRNTFQWQVFLYKICNE